MSKKLNQVIFICTTPQRFDFLYNCLSFLDGYDKYPLMVISHYDYTGKFKTITKMGDVDEFTMIHDSVEILDPTIFEMMFKDHRGENVSWYTSPYPFYMGLAKLRMDTARKVKVPVVKTKYEEVLKERDVPDQLAKLDPNFTCLFSKDEVTADVGPHPLDPNRPCWEKKWGRRNLVIGNKYFLKYKGTTDIIDVSHKLNKR